MDRAHIPSRTLGIDLASQPNETGVCLIDWATAPATIVNLGSGSLDDARLLELMTDPGVGKVGIDAPFAWPLAFVDAITTYRDQGAWLPLETQDLRLRATEIVVGTVTGKPPLSVAMSDLAWPAIRAARLFTSLEPERGPVDRTGAGWAVEVYPDAALRRWAVIAAGASTTNASYKGDKPGRKERRHQYMTTLREQLDGQVEIDTAAFDRCVADDDDLDAFVSALIARAAQLGLCDAIPRELRWAALREGWIQLPTSASLAALAG